MALKFCKARSLTFLKLAQTEREERKYGLNMVVFKAYI